MSDSKLFKKYYSRLVIEGVIKALICGLIVGFAANFAVATFTALTKYEGLWLSIGVLVGATVVATPIFYFTVFRPTTKKIVMRIDRLGLEERMLTMNELENDDSYIAMRQREDAKAALQKVNYKQIKMVIPVAIIVVASVLAVNGTAMTVVTGLADGGVISPDEFVEDLFNPPQFVVVTFLVEGDEGGVIEGLDEQLIEVGEFTETVVAVAEDEWVFVQWSDGYTLPEREPFAPEEDMELVAMFEHIEEDLSDGEGAEGEGDPNAPGAPGVPQKGEGQGGGGGESEPGPPQDSDSEGDGDGDGEGEGAGGRHENSNQIIDGKTYYRDVLQQFYDKAMEMLANGQEIPPELKAIIEAYYNIIK